MGMFDIEPSAGGGRCCLQQDLQKHKECAGVVVPIVTGEWRQCPAPVAGPAEQVPPPSTSRGEGLKVTTPSRATPAQAHCQYLPTPQTLKFLDTTAFAQKDDKMAMKYLNDSTSTDSSEILKDDIAVLTSWEGAAK